MLQPLDDRLQAVVDTFREATEHLDAVEEVEAWGTPDGGILMVLLVRTREDSVWDEITGLEYDVARANRTYSIEFRHCDLARQTVEEFAVDQPEEVASNLPYG